MDKTTQPKTEKFVCLGWGSLIWDTSRPFDVKGDWQKNGPELPLEFARQSGDNRMTLVIADIKHYVPVLWAELDAASLDEAVSLLAKREGVTRERAIGRWQNQTKEKYPHQTTIAEWAIANDFIGVVWTALEPGMKESRGDLPTLTQVRHHLATLEENESVGAIQYIHKAPIQIMTPYRSALESSFPFQDHETSEHN